jgi:hypothetical protein
MCILNGIGGGNLGFAQGRPTVGAAGMTGFSLQPPNGMLQGFDFQPNLYPRPIGSVNNINHPINLLAAAPIYLQNNEKLDNVQTNFFVSNRNSLGSPPFIPPLNPITHPYQWGWYTPVFSSSSQRGDIEIDVVVPPNIANATILQRWGWDSLAVRLINQPVGQPVYEKIIPINVR